MDDLTVEWSQERYKECTEKLLNFLSRQVGYGKNDVTFMPISSQHTIGMYVFSEFKFFFFLQ